ncbi:MAG: MBL fold metallo-hydrolase [Isosphaeraceae bacterium]|nr:MBL fold metallo-hydrolase [Isosphaeraceae bacterium]
MHITWYGHAAFLIETDGVRVILDPYRSPDSGGYLPIGEPADIVVVSHENDRYHSHLGQIVPPFDLVRGLEAPPGGTEVRGLRFEFERVFETPERKAEDEVTIVHFRAEGLHLVFLGDLGHALTADEVAPLRGADVVLAAAGGPPTIDFPEIPPLLAAIGPRLIFPMHYKTPKINLNIQPVERFLDVLPEDPVDRPGRSDYEVTRASLPDRRRIVVLDHAR